MIYYTCNAGGIYRLVAHNILQDVVTILRHPGSLGLSVHLSGKSHARLYHKITQQWIVQYLTCATFNDLYFYVSPHYVSLRTIMHNRNVISVQVQVLAYYNFSRVTFLVVLLVYRVVSLGKDTYRKSFIVNSRKRAVRIACPPTTLFYVRRLK